MTMLQTNNILLRAPEISDLDFMFHIENDTRLWMVSDCKIPYSRYLLQQYIENNAHDLYIDRQLRLMIIRRQEDKVMGCIDLFDFNPTNRRAEVGIVIDEAYRGRGYAKEALALLCNYATQTMDIHQLYAYILCDNRAACKLFEQEEFSQTATLTDWVRSGREYYPVYLYQRIFEK